MVSRPLDVLVVGAGLAGLTVALSANPKLAVALLEPPGFASSSAWARGGIAAATDPSDIADHLADTLAAGAGLVAETVAKNILAEGSEAIRWLRAQGVAFSPTLEREAGHRKPRIHHADGDRTGAAIIAALTARTSHIPRIHAYLVELAVADGRVVGAWARDPHGAIELIRARQVVLATGGAGAVFEAFTCPATNLGIGIAAAAWAGALVVDLEFIQFHPTAIAAATAPLPLPLATEALRGAGARLVDELGTPVAAGLPGEDLATRDLLARRVATWPRRVFLDARPLGPSLQSRFPGFVAAAQQLGVDPRCAPVPVRAAAHYTMGGIWTDASGHTTMPGLFAVGECAATGLHGANRLASNSLLEAVVMGRRAAGVLGEPGPRPSTNPRRPRIRPGVPLQRVRAIVDAALGPVREGGRLEEAAGRLQALRTPHVTPEEAAATWVAEAMVAAARARRGSVGAHVRSDALAEDPGYALAPADDGSLRRIVRP